MSKTHWEWRSNGALFVNKKFVGYASIFFSFFFHFLLDASSKAGLRDILRGVFGVVAAAGVAGYLKANLACLAWLWEFESPRIHSKYHKNGAGVDSMSFGFQKTVLLKYLVRCAWCHATGLSSLPFFSLTKRLHWALEQAIVNHAEVYNL